MGSEWCFEANFAHPSFPPGDRRVGLGWRPHEEDRAICSGVCVKWTKQASLLCWRVAALRLSAGDSKVELLGKLKARGTPALPLAWYYRVRLVIQKRKERRDRLQKNGGGGNAACSRSLGECVCGEVKIGGSVVFNFV